MKKRETIEEAVARTKKWMAENPSPLVEHMQKRRILEAQLVEKHGPDYNKPAARFEINNAEQAVIDAWLETLKPEICKLQGRKDPHYGVNGGGLTYSFLGTSLGDILTVKETTTGKELNVTAALDWFFFG